MTPRPDIVLLMTDQQRADSLGHAGNRFVATPNLDRLAARSLRFRNAVTPFPLCSPARAGLWTGRHAHHHGVTDNIYGEPDALGRLGRATLFPALRAAGYRTGYIGKWHLGEGQPAGFDHWAGYNSAVSHWVDGADGRRWRPEQETDEAIGLAADWTSGAPFLLVLSYYPPHPPYDAPDRYFPRYRGSGLPHAAYYAAVDGIDACVGRLLAALADRPPARPMAILYCSDHGDTFQVGKGSKRSADEAALRIPLILHVPGLAAADVAAPVSLLDVAPTLARLAGVDWAGDGHDLRAIATGTVGRHGIVVQNLVMEPIARRQGNLRQQIGATARRERVAWTGAAKLVLRESGVPLLFDLDADPEERFNLLDARHAGPASAALARSLLDQLEASSRQSGDRDGDVLAAAFRGMLGADPRR